MPTPVPEPAAIETMLATMARLQDAHNTQVASDWRTRGFAYYRAIWVECAELLDHFGWKWWKAQQPDLEQARLELVDIWHFGLSILLREERLGEAVVTAIHSGLQQPGVPDGFREAVEALALDTLQTRGFDVDAFIACMVSLDFGFEDLHRLYVGKNVLNTFRQDHGYAAGTYAKTWDGREDNEHLIEVLDALDPAAADYVAAVYAGLGARYPG